MNPREYGKVMKSSTVSEKKHWIEFSPMSKMSAGYGRPYRATITTQAAIISL
jgi:hypothetical protein